MTESYDQTQFVTEEPLYEQTTKVIAKPVLQQPTEPAKKRPHALIIAGLVLFLLLVVLILAAVMNRSQMENPADNPTEQRNNAEMGQYEQQLNELQDQLKAADPSKDDLPFPAIDMEIQLEEK